MDGRASRAQGRQGAGLQLVAVGLSIALAVMVLRRFLQPLLLEWAMRVGAPGDSAWGVWDSIGLLFTVPGIAGDALVLAGLAGVARAQAGGRAATLAWAGVGLTALGILLDVFFAMLPFFRGAFMELASSGVISILASLVYAAALLVTALALAAADRERGGPGLGALPITGLALQGLLLCWTLLRTALELRIREQSVFMAIFLVAASSLGLIVAWAWIVARRPGRPGLAAGAPPTPLARHGFAMTAAAEDAWQRAAGGVAAYRGAVIAGVVVAVGGAILTRLGMGSLEGAKTMLVLNALAGLVVAVMVVVAVARWTAVPAESGARGTATVALVLFAIRLVIDLGALGSLLLAVAGRRGDLMDAIERVPAFAVASAVVGLISVILLFVSFAQAAGSIGRRDLVGSATAVAVLWSSTLLLVLVVAGYAAMARRPEAAILLALGVGVLVLAIVTLVKLLSFLGGLERALRERDGAAPAHAGSQVP